MFHHNTKAIALLFAQKCLIFISCQSAIKINQFQFWSCSPKYQGYSLTFWPDMPQSHHFSICNQNQSISILIFCQENTKAIAFLFGKKCLIFITFHSAVNINQFQIWSLFTKIPRLQPYFLAKPSSFYHFSICSQTQSISKLVTFHKNTTAIALRFDHKCLIFITFQSAIKINQFQIWSLFTKIPRLQPLVWLQMPHFHHFSICNQNQSISNLVICHQNTKAIALLSGQTCLILITFQSAININQFQFWSFVTNIPRI